MRAVQSSALWGRYELVLLVGHVEGAGHRLVDESAAKDLERMFVDEVLAAPAERLAGERDVAAILGMARWTDQEALRIRLSDWLDDPAFVLALLRSAMLESVNETAGRAGLTKRYQHSWRGLAEMAGEERLAEAVRAAAGVLRTRELDEFNERALERAVRYAEDPAAAARDLERWGRRIGDDE